MARLRVATFNLLHGLRVGAGQGPGSAARPEDLRAAAAALDADVVGLQEVDSGQPRSGLVDQTSLVAEAMGAPSWRYAPALRGTPGTERTWVPVWQDADEPADGPSYGVGLVSRLPVRACFTRRFAPAPARIPLLVPAPGRPRLLSVPDEPRAAIAAVVDAPAGPLTVVTVHLSFVPGWNVRQLRAVTSWARTFPGPRLLVGDLNLPGALPRLATGWTQLARVATYPSPAPRVQFDHVLADGVDRDAVVSVDTPRLGVSDHLPLVVELEL